MIELKDPPRFIFNHSNYFEINFEYSQYVNAAIQFLSYVGDVDVLK